MSKPVTEVRIAEVPGGTSLLEFTYGHGVAIVPVSEIRFTQPVVSPVEPSPLDQGSNAAKPVAVLTPAPKVKK